MNYAQIQQFMTIVKHMSLTKAAKELYITQPALSHSLAKMEKELGLHLFYRMGNQLVLTAEGERLLEWFRKINDAYAGLYEDAQMLSEKQEEKILLGFSGSALIFSALFVTGFLTSYKGLPIERVFAGHSQIRTMLIHEQLHQKIQYRYSDLVEQIVHEYPSVYDNYKYHTLFLRDFDS